MKSKQIISIKLFRKLVIFIFFVTSSAIFSGEFSGWDVGKSTSTLFIEGRKVFETSRKFSSPEFLNENQKIDFSFYLTDYYLRKEDKEGIANVIFFLRSEKGDYKLADYFISSLWRMKKNDIDGAKKKLNEFIEISTDNYQKALASQIINSFTQKNNPPKLDESPEKLICTRNQNYYSLCRFLKLKHQIDQLSHESNNRHRDYLNLDRILAPFFEEYILNYPHLIHWIVPELSEKLAYLGFANEAIHFQNIVLQKEQMTGTAKISTYEKISFYQMLNGNLLNAEEILHQAIRLSVTKSIEEKNQIYLKLGAIAYIRKDYRQSLNYYMNLDFKKWDKTIYNPFRFEPISINEAKDLISVSIWKVRGPVKAIKALKLIQKSNKKLDEEELLIRTRIAQIIFPDKPETAEKLADEIIYTAQSRGWKRAEYAGTLLQGYIHIINKNYRKSVIHFTKSYGILGESNPEMISERIRLSGIISAHIASGESAPIEKLLLTLIKYLRTELLNDDLSIIKYYLDLRFDYESLIKKSITYLSDTKNYSSLLKLLYSTNKANYFLSGINSKGVLQIPFVSRRMSLYYTFRPKDEKNFFSNIQDKLRKQEFEKGVELFDDYEDTIFSHIKNPILAGFAYQKEIYLFFYLPEKTSDSHWKLVKFTSSDYKGNAYNNALIEFSEQVPQDKVLQIYFNSIGIDIHQYLRSKRNKQYSLFHNFSIAGGKNKQEITNLTPIAILPNNKPVLGVQNYSIANFEGTKTFNEKHRLHIWNFQGAKKDSDSLGIENYYWTTNNKEFISFKKMQRRLDARISPNALIFTSDTLKKSFWDSLSGDFYPFCDFWFRKGVDTIYYIPSLNFENEKHIKLIKILSSPLNSSEELYKISVNSKSISDDIILIQSTLK
ncbi:MAG: hypothetical protein L6Q54_15130 [Leptospiraceae bacterium]|nr:hypothetical protein [Leptospiraceae bacterium]MCK6382567.1 hypothetical protein [Leptospiraceae bacterium]NUM42132.1 hypothetical protein [Leptospiraceae bacterium]